MQTVPDPHSSPSTLSTATSPDYEALVRYLAQPFLESSDSLRIDSEVSPRTSRVLIRLAIEGEDKGRVFGRGGRNIQAIRTVIAAIAQSAGQAAHLEVFGSQSIGREHREESEERSMPRSQPRRPPKPRSPRA